MSERELTANSTRRKFLAATGAASVTFAAGCLGGGDDDGILFLLNPAEENIDIEVQYQPLIEHVESEVDVEIEATPTSSYSATVTSLESGDGELADTSPGAVIAAEGFADVLGIRKAFGSERYFSLITTRPDTGITELSELAGERVALGATTSVSGGFVPLLMLKQAGLDIGNAPRGEAEDLEIRFTGDHFTAINGVIEDDTIAAAGTGAFVAASNVPQEQFDQMSQDFVDISAEYDSAGEDTSEAELRLLSVSDPIPRAPIMIRSDWEHEKREDIEQALLNAPDDAFQHEEGELAEELDVDPDTEEGQEVISNHEIWFSDIVEADASQYEPIRDILNELGLEFEDIS